jgi:hypothetical protein
LLPAAIAGVPPLFWVLDATNRASLSTLGRDQGIFQYVAWAILHGAKDYRDVRDVNGPLTHLVHMIFLALGGADEHRFRVLDLLVTGLSFALVGACIPGIARRATAARRVGWACAAWVVLSGQYLLYLFWDIAQRENFFDWFMLSSVALQLVAQDPARRTTERARGLLLALCGALSVIPWFGKPTYVLFSIAQAAALLAAEPVLHVYAPRARTSVAVPFGRSAAPRARTSGRRAAVRWFAIGGGLGALTQVAFLLAFADLGAFVRIYFVDVPRMYRFIWPRTPVEIFSMAGNSTTAALALVTSVVLLGLIADGRMPRRALAVALLPLCGLGSVIAQGKGFPYHFHPVSAALHIQWLLIVVWLWERREQKSALAPYVAASGLALKVALTMPMSPHVQNLWILSKARDAEERSSRDYLVYFQTADFFPWEMRQTAEYLRAHTKPTDRVQTYGMDPYVLFLAERKSATPYIYAYDLNADAALDGGQLPQEGGGLHPNGFEQAAITKLRDEHEADLLRRLEKEPPAAFVFFDKAPLISWQDAVVDFGEHCKATSAWVKERYVQTAVFGDDRVWMRRDLAESVATQSPVQPGSQQ